MEPYTVVCSGEIDKRIHDQQIRSAPPTEDKRRSMAIAGDVRTTESEVKLFFALLGIGRSRRGKRVR
jgi:hypothetical protein